MPKYLKREHRGQSGIGGAYLNAYPEPASVGDGASVIWSGAPMKSRIEVSDGDLDYSVELSSSDGGYLEWFNYASRGKVTFRLVDGNGNTLATDQVSVR